MSEYKAKKGYRGRIAPTPSGYLHEGHAQTFQIAWKRCRDRAGVLAFRNDDLDTFRCNNEFTTAAMGLKIEKMKSIFFLRNFAPKIKLSNLEQDLCMKIGVSVQIGGLK